MRPFTFSHEIDLTIMKPSEGRWGQLMYTYVTIATETRLSAQNQFFFFCFL